MKRDLLSWRFWKSSAKKGEFSILNPGRFDENEKLFEDLQKFGVTQINEGGSGDYLDCLCIRYVPANEWNMYEADESGAKARLFFSKLLRRFTPLLSAFGFFYDIFRAVNAEDPIC